MNKRLPVFDWIRSVAIFTILFHHLPGYTFDFYDLRNFGIPLDLSLLGLLSGFLGLALFIFMSGYLLNIKKIYFSTWAEIQVFAKRKLIRIFPLYYLALIAFALIEHVYNPLKILLHLSGLQLLFRTPTSAIPIRTLWFVGFITVFYSVFTVVKNRRLDKNLRISILMFSLIVPLILNVFFSLTDYRLSLYWGIFWFGVFCAEKELPKLTSWKYLSQAAAVVFVAVVIYFAVVDPLALADSKLVTLKGAFFQKYLILNALMFSFVITAYNVCKWLAQCFNWQSGLQFISYISYCMYLFHRPIWYVMSQLLVNQVSVDNKYLLLTILITCGLPLIIAVSYALQRVYDQYVSPRLMSAFKVA